MNENQKSTNPSREKYTGDYFSFAINSLNYDVPRSISSQFFLRVEDVSAFLPAFLGEHSFRKKKFHLFVYDCPPFKIVKL